MVFLIRRTDDQDIDHARVFLMLDERSNDDITAVNLKKICTI